jgi:two-component system nitrogen regulation sensor histidine kinase GlnL
VLEFLDTERDRRVRREAELVAQQRLSRRIIRQLAHEVKNPLGGLRGAAQLLERQLPNPDQKAYTRVIIEEADRLAALVDGILRAGGAPKQEEINLHRITEHVAQLIEAEKPAGVELVRDYDPSLPSINVDRNQMIQALLNVGRNAMQALGERGRLIFRTRALTNFTVGGERHRLVLSAEVEDNGPGIPAELKETIFYPLVTGRPTGTGLGLTIAQDLVSRNGGLIEFTSEPGRTVFQIRLPVANGAR